MLNTRQRQQQCQVPRCKAWVTADRPFCAMHVDLMGPELTAIAKGVWHRIPWSRPEWLALMAKIDIAIKARRANAQV